MAACYKAVVLLLFIHSLLCPHNLWGFSGSSLFNFAVLYVHSNFAIISLGKGELVALILLCAYCHVTDIVL